MLPTDMPRLLEKVFLGLTLKHNHFPSLQTLMQRGLIPGAKVDDSAIEREIVINDAPTAIRSQLTRRPVQEEVRAFCQYRHFLA